MNIDTDELKRNSDIVDVIAAHVPLVRRGAEYYGVCPFHDDTKESLQVRPSKQVFKCFACEVKGGDSIQFLQLMGYTFHQACEEINGGPIKGDVTPIKSTAKTRKVDPVWVPVLPVKKLSPTFKHYFFGEIKKKWAYVDKQGKVLGYVCRFDFPDGHKEVWPLTYATDGTRTEWRC